MATSKFPDWVLKHKKKGTEIRYINGNYYLYRVTSKWDPQKKRSQKVTLEFLGKITKEGFIESEKRKLRRQASQFEDIAVVEYGISALIQMHLDKYRQMLKHYFPSQWKFIIALSYGRFVYQTPLKNAQYYYQRSYLSKLNGNGGLSKNLISENLRKLGRQRESIVEFFKQFRQSGEYIVFDGTDLFSRSKHLEGVKVSRTKTGNFSPMLNLLFAFSSTSKQPYYYRILPGDIKDVKSLQLSIKEAGLSDVVVIGDKGFYSEENVKNLESVGLQYILPLKRNSSLIEYDRVKVKSYSEYDGYFRYNGRVIWYVEYEASGRRIIIYKDKDLEEQEVSDYLFRVEDDEQDEYTMDTFFRKEWSFGTLSIISNEKDRSASELYQIYKSRSEIEELFDVFKNLGDHDRTYMQDKDALEGLMFVNYIAMHWHYYLYRLLQEKKLLKTYSVKDILMFLRGIKKVRINGQWYLAEITNKTKKLLEKLDLHIT